MGRFLHWADLATCPFEIEERAAKKAKIEPNRATGTIPMIENDEMVMGKYQFGS